MVTCILRQSDMLGGKDYAVYWRTGDPGAKKDQDGPPGL
jgi:hypothetical protein